LKIVYLGDVVGRSGRDAVFNNIEAIREKFRPDVFIVNVENSAHGFGATPGICRDFLSKGVDALVMGNHTFKHKELMSFLDENKRIIRPMNFPASLPGKGFIEIEAPSGKKLLIVQVLGRVYMEAVDCPVQSLDNLLKNYTLGKNIDAIFVDIHAEATSEKQALGHYLDGRVSAVAGTHTHVPTADARILKNGTAYITDVGMCGDYDSVIGSDKEEPINRLINRHSTGRLSASKGKGTVYGVFIETDDKTGLGKSIELFWM
jgi:hypothetical protein